MIIPLQAQRTYKYRIHLTDKATTNYTLDRPEEYLSDKALQRRAKQHLKVDSTDLPVCRTYINAIKSCGVEIVITGKWNNTVIVQCKDTAKIDQIALLPFVETTQKVWISPDSLMVYTEDRKTKIENKLVKTDNLYGPAYRQIAIHHGDSLHRAGFRGEGMTIAVIDAGYYNADLMKVLKKMNLLGVRDFVNDQQDIYARSSHGMKVLSCMAANAERVMVGTAPQASYWLLRSEDEESEHLVEQDYWAAAIEFADSVGVDVVNTSLGYKTFDDKSKNYRYRDLDGKYSLMSRSAGMAADKGMVVVCSGGNEGNKTWKKITPPADAFNVLAVAAVDSSLVNASFSSVGNTADGRVKPDVSAIGKEATVLDIDGNVSKANGTSFASPIFCGLVACLWQARPELTAKELMELIKKSGDRADFPDNIFGYGVPDMWKAFNTK
ncbi:MAG: S8 family serine peptidase [Bacteroidaceae bacterium]